MALAESWSFKSRSRHCAATGRPFEEGEEIVTVLERSEAEGFERHDFSLAGWDQRAAAGGTPFSVWRSTFRTPPATPKPTVVARESAEDLLRRLIDEDDERTENVRYILAVMLERQRLLRETDCQRTGAGILRVYEHRKTGEVLLIRDPDIPLDRVGEVQQEVLAMLGSNQAAHPDPGSDAGPSTMDATPAEPALDDRPDHGRD